MYALCSIQSTPPQLESIPSHLLTSELQRWRKNPQEPSPRHGSKRFPSPARFAAAGFWCEKLLMYRISDEEHGNMKCVTILDF